MLYVSPISLALRIPSSQNTTALVLISIVAFTLKHLSGALESGHKYCHYFRTETLARYSAGIVEFCRWVTSGV